MIERDATGDCDVYQDGPLWIVAMVVTALTAVAAEIGYRLGKQTTACESTLTAVKSSILALVGLMLAFSYSIAVEHYDRRTQGLLAEANALKTCWLRTDLAEEPARSRTRDQLRAIIDERLASLRHPDAKADAERELHIMHSQRELWALAATQLDQSREPEKHLLLAQAVNDVIDRSGERTAAFAERVPTPVSCLLIAIILVAGFLIGLSSGQDNRRVPALWGLVTVLMVVMLTMIFDLDNPGRGLIPDRSQPMEDLKAMIDAPIRG
jgi:hypothetical protein